VTVAPSSKLGLDPFLRMDGLALRLAPAPSPDEDYRISVDILRKNLFDEPEGFSRTPEYGFKWRGLADTTIYNDENQRRLMINYRNSFFRLSYYYADRNDKGRAIATVNRMDQVISQKVFPIDWRLKADLAMFLHRVGETEQFERYAAELEKTCWLLIESGQGDVRTYWNPYRILLDLYEVQGRYSQALNVLNRLSASYPNDPSIQRRIAEVQEQMRVDSVRAAAPRSRREADGKKR